MTQYYNVNSALQHQYNPDTAQWQPELVPDDALATIAPTASYDYISLSYTGSNLTTVTYKTGGATGTTVATLTLTYDGANNLTSVARS